MIIRAVNDATEVFKSLGTDVREIDFPDPMEMLDDWFGVCAVQAACAHEGTYPARKDEYAPALSELLDLGNSLSGLDYHKLQLRRADYRGRLEAVLAGVDFLLIPAMGFITPKVERMEQVDEEMILGFHRFTCRFAMAGVPTITMPAAFTRELAGGVQLVGRHFAEGTLLRAGHAFQCMTDWHKRRPTLSNRHRVDDSLRRSHL